MNYISGFKGSNGQIVVTKTEALLWTDGRYFLQAENELYPGWKLMKMSPGVPRYFEWLTLHSPADAKIAFDPYLVTASALKNRRPTFQAANLLFDPIEPNLVNLVWPDRPGLSTEPVVRHPEEYTGETMREKLERIKPTFEEHKANYLFTSLLDEIAWVMNLRGRDIEFNPVFFAYLLIHLSGDGFKSTLFIEAEKVTPEVREYLSANEVTIEAYNRVGEVLKGIGEKVIVDADELNSALYSIIPQAVQVPQVITKLKGTKNTREIEGMKACHIRDGRALCRYLAWLDQQLEDGRTDLTEHTAALQLESFRSSEALYKGLSFETISAVGPNAAIIHYKPEPPTAALIKQTEIYLVDSGGQYWDGTTDVTRTVHFGQPSQREKECYTRVLLGNLDLCRLKWPKGLSGEDMDVLARRWLWESCLNYNHGTGHGVGYYLNVHEGPHGIGKYWTAPLQPGMLVTDEPGYYEDHQFGIRIEDVLLVTRVNDEFYTFENITMCPYDRNLLDLSLLSPRDVEYLNSYHTKVWETLAPLLQEDKLTLAWLQKATAPL